jgi:hypothetical protein
VNIQYSPKQFFFFGGGGAVGGEYIHGRRFTKSAVAILKIAILVFQFHIYTVIGEHILYKFPVKDMKALCVFFLQQI